MVVDIVEIRGIEEHPLGGIDPLSESFLHREVGVGGKTALGVVLAQFDAANLPLRIVEGAQDRGGPELAVVDQVGRLFVVTVQSHLVLRGELVSNA